MDKNGKPSQCIFTNEDAEVIILDLMKQWVKRTPGDNGEGEE